MAAWQHPTREAGFDLLHDPELSAFEHEMQLLEATYALDWGAVTHPLEVPAGLVPASGGDALLASGSLDEVDALLSMQPLPPSLWETAVAAQAQHPCASAGGSAASGLVAASASPSSGCGSGGDSSGCVPAPPARPARDRAAGAAKGKGTGGKAANRYATAEARARKQEQQRQYRLRVKQRQAQQESTLRVSEAQLEALKREKKELLEHQAALEKLQEYRERLAGVLPIAPRPASHPASLAPLGALPAVAEPENEAEEGEGEDLGGCTEAADVWAPGLGMQLAEGGPQPVQRVARALDEAVEDAVRSGQRVQLRAAEGEEPRSVERVACIMFSALPASLLRRLLLPGDQQMRSLLTSMTAEQFAVRERGFRHILQSFLDEWELSGPAGRQKVERRLEVVWAVREKGSALLAKLRPDLLCEVIRTHVLPDPPEARDALRGCCPVHHLLPRAVELVAVKPHQRRAILAAWTVYKQRVAVARQACRGRIDGMQEVGRRQRAAEGAMPLSAIMKDYVTAFEASAELAALPQQEVQAWMQLSLSAYQVLTPLQRSRLVLACSPFMPDSTQICRLLEWQDREGLRVQAGWPGAADDPGHLLAAFG